MSVPTRQRAIVDAGLKSYSAEKGLPWVHGRDGVSAVGASDEHGKLELGPEATPLALGDKVLLIPGHCDPTVNLHEWYVAVRKGRVEGPSRRAARAADARSIVFQNDTRQRRGSRARDEPRRGIRRLWPAGYAVR